MFLSAPRAIEESVEPGTAQFVFECGAGDELALLGYAVGARDGATIYEMARGTAVADAADRDAMVVLVASAR